MSGVPKFHFELATFKKTLLKKKKKKNAYSTKFVEKCVVNFVNNIFAQKTYAASVPKLDFRIALPY